MKQTEINNSNIIRKIIKSDFDKFQNDTQHIFYILKVMLRSKDGAADTDTIIYTRTINTIYEYDKYVKKAIELAEKTNGRVYLSISPKNKELALLKVAQEFIKINVEHLIFEKPIENIVYDVSSRSGLSVEPRVIFDFDINDNNDIDTVIKFFNNLKDKYNLNYYHFTKTVNGFHIISDLSFDFFKDEVLSLIDDKLKDILKRSFLEDNHLTELPTNIRTRRLLSNTMHKDSGNALIFYKLTK